MTAQLDAVLDDDLMPTAPEMRRSVQARSGSGDTTFRLGLRGAGIVVIMTTIGVLHFHRGATALGQAGPSFLTTQAWVPDAGNFGIATVVAGTLLIAAVAVSCAVPLATYAPLPELLRAQTMAAATTIETQAGWASSGDPSTSTNSGATDSGATDTKAPRAPLRAAAHRSAQPQTAPRALARRTRAPDGRGGSTGAGPVGARNERRAGASHLGRTGGSSCAGRAPARYLATPRRQRR